MKLSLFFDVNPAPDISLENALRAIEERVLLAEALGFDTAWFAEHHFGKQGRLVSPLHFIARLSGITRSIQLGTAVLPAPFYNPVRLKEELELVDALAGGRLKVGLGFGESGDSDCWDAFGAAPDERVERTRVIAGQLTDTFGQRLYIAGGSQTPDWIAASGYGLLLPRVGGTENHLCRLACYRAGSGEHSGRVAALRLIYVAPTGQEAQAATLPLVTRLTLMEARDAPPQADLLTYLNLAVGDTEQVRERLFHWQQTLGIDELLCQVDAPELSHQDSLRTLQLLGALIPLLNKVDKFDVLT